MEAIHNGGGPMRLNGPNKTSAISLKSKDDNPLKIVESGDISDQVTSEKSREPEETMDPYKELELYLAKVNEEIGEIIESVPPIKAEKRRTLSRPSRDHGDLGSLVADTSRLVNGDGSRSNSIRRRRQFELHNRNEILDNWSENFLAEFNSIIANEINELTKADQQKKFEEPKQCYKDLLNKFGISNSESSTEDEKFAKDQKPINENAKGKDKMTSRHQHMLNSDYDEPKDQIRSTQRLSGSLPENLEDSLNNTTSDYDEPSNCLGSKSTTELQRTRRNSSSLPSGFNARFAIPKNSVEKQRSNVPQVKPLTDPMPRSNRMLRALKSKNGLEDAKAKLPPQPVYDSKRKTSLPNNSLLAYRKKSTTTNHYGKIQKLKPSELEPDYEEIREPYQFVINKRSKSADNKMPRSAPSTPTEIKRTPFSRLLLRKNKHTPIFGDSSPEAILVSVSSLPDQDLVNLSNDRKDDTKKITTPLKDVESSKKKRAMSPLTLRSDITGKRLSESDKDVTQISPVEMRRFHVAGKSNGNDVAVSCDFPEVERNEVDGNIAANDAAAGKMQENGEVKILMEEQSSRSASLPISLQSLLSRLTRSGGSCCSNSPPIEGLACSDIATQTSPAVSRSSSFTWVSDCDSPHHDLHADARSLQDEAILNPASPQNTVDDDNRSSSSSQDLLQSMDEISSGSLSPDTTDRASPLESGIGTASPPRSTDRRLAKPPPSGPSSTKCHRKETWERIRRRPSKLSSSRGIAVSSQDEAASVWIKRESVHTQTRPDEEERDYSQEAVDSSSGLDDSLPRAKAARPNNLPLGLSTTASSSLSSGELLGTLPRALSSPSTASLQLKTSEPLAIELTGKSSSAPLLDNNNCSAEKNVAEEPSLQQPRSQSERQLSGKFRP